MKMSEGMKYCSIVKRAGKVLLKIEDNCQNKLIAILSCKLEDDYPDAKGQVFRKTTGEIVYQCRRTAIC